MDNAVIHESDFSLWFISKFCDKYGERGKKLDWRKKKKGGGRAILWLIPLHCAKKFNPPSHLNEFLHDADQL